VKLRVARKVFSRDPDAFAELAGCLILEEAPPRPYPKATLLRAWKRWQKRVALMKRYRRLGRSRPYFDQARLMAKLGPAW